jgi:hypothetical protein
MSDDDSASEPPLIDALHRVYIDSLPAAERNAVNARASDAVRDLDRSTALKTIANSELDRLHKWHVVASAIHRQPDFVADEETRERVIDVIIAVPEAGPIEVDRDGLRGQLATFAAGQDDLTLSPERWSEFYTNVLQADAGLREHATEHDADKPGCNDAPSDAGPGLPTIVSRFWTSKPLDGLRPYVNPLNWPQLGSEYWQDMSPVEGPTNRPDGYDAVFREVVKLPTGTITVYLDVSFREGPEFALTTYREAPDRPSDARLDRGYVFATNATVGRFANQTLVYSTKSIIFTDDELNGFTDIACDNGWVDLMIHMALPPGRRTEIQPKAVQSQAGVAGRPPSEVDLWAHSVNHLVERCVDRTRVAVGAVGHGRIDLELLDELLTAGDDVTASISQGAKAWREVLGKLAEAGGGR